MGKFGSAPFLLPRLVPSIEMFSFIKNKSTKKVTHSHNSRNILVVRQILCREALKYPIYNNRMG